MKMLYRPQSQCFQRPRGPRMAKSEGRQILLFESRFPKQGGVELTHLMLSTDPLYQSIYPTQKIMGCA